MGRRWLAFASTLLCFLASVSPARGDAGENQVPSPPAPESMTASVVPKPAGVAEWGRRFQYTAGGDMVATFKAAPEAKTSVGWLRADGSGFHCLTCDVFGSADVGAPLPFPDGRRVFVQSPSNMDAAGAFGYYVLECAPSLENCAASSAEPVSGLVSGLTDSRGVQDREMRLSKDGTKLLWTRIRPDGYFMLLGDIVATGDGYELSDVRVVNPPGGDLFGTADALALGAPWYEAKDLSYDGRPMTFSGSLAGSLNYDNFTLDLGTGQVRRLTFDPDWDEDAGISPDGQWFVSGTSKGMNRQAAWGNAVRPPLADIAMVGPLSNMFLPRTLPGTGPSPQRLGSLHHVVVDRHGERGDYNGQAIAPPQEPEWAAAADSTPDWSPDGTRLLRIQTRRDPVTGADVETRMQVVTLADRVPVSVLAGTTVTPQWAPLLEDVAVRTNVSYLRRLDGPAGGAVTVLRLGNMLFGFWLLNYQGYSSDGCSVLNGTQSTFTLLGILADFREATTVAGCHNGFTQAQVRFGGAASNGGIVSEYDGRRFERTIPFTLEP